MNVLKKANLLSQTKQVSNKDRKITIQITTTGDSALEELPGQRIWPFESYFKSQVTDSNMEKVNNPDNLCESSISGSTKDQMHVLWWPCHIGAIY